MKVPEKLYLHPTASGNVGASWLSFPLTDKDIEYTRTDAFIEKACKWLRKELVNFEDYSGMGEELISDFRKAMEE